jgi:hypothetical protein
MNRAQEGQSAANDPFTQAKLMPSAPTPTRGSGGFRAPFQADLGRRFSGIVGDRARAGDFLTGLGWQLSAAGLV